ncbi:MAG: ribonuclease HII [Candidatus Nanopelagicales bacterium]
MINPVSPDTSFAESTIGVRAFPIEYGLLRRGFTTIAGADEAGRGAGAGPLVAAAVVFKPSEFGSSELVRAVNDSKKLTESRREELFIQITEQSLSWAVVSISAAEVDARGIQRANLTALRQSVACLDVQPDYALFDGYSVPGAPMPSLGVWKGDQVSPTVAAASILAKVTRDRHMVEAETSHPGYGFAKHKGYLTADHRAAIEKLGVCEIHRSSFALR